MDLGEYELGLLSSNRRDEVAAHTASCPHCQVDLVQMRNFMEMPAIGIETAREEIENKSPLFERMKLIVVDMLSLPANMQRSTGLQPVLRGSESESNTSVIQADAYIVALTAKQEKANWPKQHIIGDITPLTDDDETFQDWTAYLWQSGQLLATSAVAKDSHFKFDHVQIGELPHELILSGPTVEIHLQNLHIA